MPIDPRTPCLIGVGKHTWHPDEVGEQGAPEPLDMWERVARAAADDSGVGARALEGLDALDIVYCQTWQYDDAPARLSDRLGVSPKRQHYSGIGGTTPQVLATLDTDDPASSKAAITAAAEVLEGLGQELRTAFEKESKISSWIFQTEDAKEGPKAFAEKRPPVWQAK